MQPRRWGSNGTFHHQGTTQRLLGVAHRAQSPATRHGAAEMGGGGPFPPGLGVVPVLTPDQGGD